MKENSSTTYSMGLEDSTTANRGFNMKVCGSTTRSQVRVLYTTSMGQSLLEGSTRTKNTVPES